jgi:hypothetical protein
LPVFAEDISHEGFVASLVVEVGRVEESDATFDGAEEDATAEGFIVQGEGHAAEGDGSRFEWVHA